MRTFLFCRLSAANQHSASRSTRDCWTSWTLSSSSGRKPLALALILFSVNLSWDLLLLSWVIVENVGKWKKMFCSFFSEHQWVFEGSWHQRCILCRPFWISVLAQTVWQQTFLYGRKFPKSICTSKLCLHSLHLASFCFVKVWEDLDNKRMYQLIYFLT